MSKPTIRIVVSVLIGLSVLLAVFASVQAASSKASLSGERVFTTAGLLPDTNHVRSAAQMSQGLSSSYFDEGAYQYKGEGHGGCERDNHESPDD